MIQSIAHKGLNQYYQTGNGSKLPQDFLRKIARILTVLDAVTKEEDIWQSGSGIHRLSGDLSDYWSIKVSGNYRIIFRFKDGDVFDVAYLDYH
jgi:toxin HigB-1